MSKEITPVPFSKVPVLEYPELVNTTVGIVDRYGAETMFVKATHDALKARVPQLSLLNVKPKKHPESEMIKSLQEKRKSILRAFVKQTRTLRRAGLASHTVEMVLVSLCVEKYWAGFYGFNLKTINAMTVHMFAEIQSTPALKTAFDVVGLGAHVQELKTVEANLNAAKTDLSTIKGLILKANSKQIMMEVSETMNDLVSAIELARKAHPEVNYTPMITELNRLFTSYQSEIKTHSTWLKSAGTITPTPVALSSTTIATAV